ncbi:neurogenic locus notch homolog protein 1-like [Bradysia coprophila]|uniref:neurogenic locus notch homolog protein 1-like n=1 Tax=Bradysia coprophila TaxID=38358 RepID=UPI00187D7120|nr:neurogenic locus notch homolog protein 1-like [Bradysia coprophila]
MTINHNPICKCLPNYTGNPFFRCTQREPEEECPPNACGNNTVCKVLRSAPRCTCLNEYVGNPMIGCHRECESNDECGSEGRCTNFLCYPDVAPGGLIRLDDSEINPEHPCDPNPCRGYNEFCRELKGHAFCQCQYAPFRRLPESGCNPECGTKFDCPANETCLNNKCVQSCPGDCSPSEECFVFNHQAKCRPKNSRPECSSNNVCSSDEACDGYKCVDPCLDYCVERHADCQIVNQQPICNCKPGYHRHSYGGCYRDGVIYYVE